MIPFLEGKLWQAGTIAASGAAIALAVALGVTTLQKNSAVKRADGLQQQIDHPITGYRARLSSCQGNLKVVETVVATQNKAIANLGRESDARVAQAEAGLAAAQRDAAAARYRAERLADATFTGTTVCERVQDADRQVMEMLR